MPAPHKTLKESVRQDMTRDGSIVTAIFVFVLPLMSVLFLIMMVSTPGEWQELSSWAAVSMPIMFSLCYYVGTYSLLRWYESVKVR